MALTGEMLEQFAQAGFLGPVRVLTEGECRRLLRAFDLRPQPALDWEKGASATSRAYYEIATWPPILDAVSELLGGDVILWGTSIQRRVPHAVHPWHSDIESSAPDSRTVSVWIGLEGTTPESSLLALSRSHRLGMTVQQVRHENGWSREDADVDDLVDWARQRDGECELIELGATDGDAVFFDGRLWHGTHNVSNRVRRALLLQYGAPDTRIRLPDLNWLDWPFQQLDRPRPPCLILRGSASEGVNRIVPAPMADSQVGQPIRLTSRIHPLRLPLSSDEAWKPFPAFDGSTAVLPRVECHASVLAPGCSPHPPHQHPEEELLLLLAGEVELDLVTERRQLLPGQFVHYPSNFAHTLQTTGDEPATYVMFKWRGESTEADRALPFGEFDTAGESRVLIDGSTRYLRKLQSHLTVLAPGEGYEPHADAYDVAIVVIEGELETIGSRAAPNDVIFYAAGEPHGMRNVGDEAARYVVFEFHGRTSLASGAPSPARAFFEELVTPRHWKRKLKKLLRR
jgi:quercetin dioxygenase-like cupin family protein